MMKKTLIGVLALLLTLSFIGVVMGAGKGNARKGKYTYRKVYKSCFDRGAVESLKPPLSPDAKTQAQWTRVFEKKDFDQFGCKKEWSALTDKELNDVYAYLHEHAADSPSPAKCK
jgi:hypothetical protein